MKGEDSLDEAGDPGGRAPRFAEEPPGREVATACSTRARIFAWDRFTACWPVERALPASPARGAGFGESVDDAEFSGRALLGHGRGHRVAR